MGNIRQGRHHNTGARKHRPPTRPLIAVVKMYFSLFCTEFLPTKVNSQCLPSANGTWYGMMRSSVSVWPHRGAVIGSTLMPRTRPLSPKFRHAPSLAGFYQTERNYACCVYVICTDTRMYLILRRTCAPWWERGHVRHLLLRRQRRGPPWKLRRSTWKISRR